MGFLILAAFISVPLIEIGLFIQVGGAIGLWPTLAVVFLTAIAGTALLRHQGLDTLARLQANLDQGQMPLGPVFDGFCLLAAGALLLTPGFFTDAVGFALFIPPFRRYLGQFLARHVNMRAHVNGNQNDHSGHNPGHPQPSGDIIDGEWRDVTDEQNDPKLPPRSSS